jgi:hypothetical protein
MKLFPIAPHAKTAAILFGIGLTIVGCQTIPPQAEKPMAKPPGTGIVAATPAQTSPESAPMSEPEIKSETKPVPARSLTTPTKPVKEQKLAENSSTQKPLANRALLFSCGTENGKEILLYQTDETIDYSFGDRDAKPELELTVPRNRASTWQWKGVGRAMTYAVDVPNGDTSYSVFWSVDRLSETKAVEAGVRVHSNRKTLATVYCTGKVVNNLQGVQLKPTEY